MDWLKYARDCGFAVPNECIECFKRGGTKEDCEEVGEKGEKGWSSCPLEAVKQHREDIKQSLKEAEEYLEEAKQLRKRLKEARKGKKKE